ncbi:MAG: hypothetical protein IKK10_03040 [Clostridia bacterium]|nr:hypothetical protein [Clostridia bacterium]
MDKMQEDALRRVREMQSANPGRRPQQSPQTSDEKFKIEEVQNKEINKPDSAPKDPLAGLFKDKEKLLILLLVMLLSQESSNTELILALLYIII